MAEKEYIEREALEKFVSSVRRDLPLESPDFLTRDNMLLNFEQYIHLMPAADVVEVVRCKECKHYQNHPNGLCYLHTEPYGDGYKGDAVCVEPNGFCSYGERKDG